MNKILKNLVLMTAIAGISTTALTGCGGNDNKNESSGESTTVASGTDTTKDTEATKGKYTTVVAGASDMNGVFSPFFSTTLPDRYGFQYVIDSLAITDRQGGLTPGIADFEMEEIKADDGSVKNTIYRFKIKDGVTFSDGEPMTADDIIFSYKVYSDPTYDGSTTLFSSPIIGINEYRYDDIDYATKIAKMKEDSKNITDEEVNKYILDVCTADYDSEGDEAIVKYMGGLDGLDGLDDTAKKEKVVNAYVEYEKANNLEAQKESAITQKYSNLETEYIKANLASGKANVPEITGIKKIDEKTVEVTIDGVDPKALDNLAGSSIAPEHYYGVGKDGTKFTKGNLSMVREKNGSPMGSGPYTFEKFENNVVTLKANQNYYKGTPKTPTIKIQVTNKSNLFEAIKTGDLDISQPDSTPKMLEDVKAAGLHAELVDNLGYGYIGMNSERISDKNVRKGLMHLMNRKPAVETAYGELASVIERPMSKVSWAYPENATEYYGFDPTKALDYFTKAGYTQVDKSGKKSLEKDGKQLQVEVGIPGSGTMNHPSAPILTQMKTEMDKLGAVLNISDVDGAVFFDKLNNHTWDMFVAAWSATPDPDMYQVYYSSAGSNHYRIDSAELDKLILEGRQTNDKEIRKGIYSKALDIIMEEAVEMPVYQRKNMTVFNPEIVNIKSLPENPSPYYTPFFDYCMTVDTLELN